MATQSRARRAAALAIIASMATVVAGSSAHAGTGGGQLTFDELTFAGPSTTLSLDHYLDQGILFLDNPTIWNVAAGHPDELQQFVNGGFTPNMGLVLSVVFGPLFIDIQFVVPDTFEPAVTDWVSALAVDTNVGTLLGSIEAFDIDGNSIGFASAVTDSSWTGTLAIQAEGIHRIRLSSDIDGNVFDNIAWGELSGVSPGDIPAPGALALMAMAGLARRRRRNA